ncbi:hypothetical protein [Saccharicrinis fermentans]|uniref:Uncharacterized protein n=2 Tax=Saccharicrinis fermentans TaxID=982 RepID=W7YBZ5_9BACT|nr:hypothetical protein [Saccharicrinis fermentans]GAF05977.1 hypothetical protein JCM21142_134742 [Saccharicrinis fermentans DSM 9555 = JCM 21142]
MGILSESKKHAPEDFGRACKKALEMKVYTCKFIRNTLKYKTFNLDAEEEIRRIMDDNETRRLDILN